MLETLRQYIAADLQRFMERLNGVAWGRGLGPAEKRGA